MRGDIWWADLNPTIGSEQAGAGLVLVISYDSSTLVPGW
jgi:mRNA-degrading endonuclease toxin of MazEF toxin-antitoxin module